MEKRRILIVEDEALVAENTRRLLMDAGYDVPCTARTCEEAIQKAREFRPHLVLMDIVLDESGCDGVDLQKQIHEELSIPVIFLTALSDRGIVDRAKDSYSYGYLLKPVSEKELMITVETSLKRHELEESLRLSEEKFRSIYESSPIGIELYNADGRLVSLNTACMEIFGLESAESVRGFNLFEDPNIPDDEKKKLSAGETIRYEALFDFELVREKKLFPTSRTGTITIDVLITPLSETGRGSFHGYLVHVQDITPRKVYENTLRELSLVDQLTGLYNRRGFLKLAGQHSNIAERNGERLSIVFLDLNGLKKINDTHGHQEGDRALIQAASVLRISFRNSDVLSRWGGDEFAVLMVNAKNGYDESVEKRLLGSIHDINREGLLKEPLSISWGAVPYEPGKGQNIEDIIIKADEEMYRHKRGLR